MHKFIYMLCKSRGKYFLYFKLKDTLIYILHLLNWPFLAFLTSENDIIYSVTLCHSSQLWHIMVHYNVQRNYFFTDRSIFPWEIPFLIPSKITKNSIRNVIWRCTLTSFVSIVWPYSYQISYDRTDWS